MQKENDTSRSPLMKGLGKAKKGYREGRDRRGKGR